MNKKIILSIFLIALALRIFLIPNRGFEADVAFWKSWGLSALDNGVVEGIGITNNNYPTPFSYLLALLAYVYRLFADPHIFDSYWNSGNVLFLLISKLPSILSDMGIAALILWIGGRARRIGFPDLHFNIYLLMVVLYLFNPVSLIDGALWGQVDSLGVFVFLIAVVLAASDKPVLAGAVFMLSMMTKLQNMIYGPLFFLLLWQLGSFKGLVRGIIGAISAFFILNGEFLLKKNMGAVWESLTSNYDYFPLMSLNAFNVWWIAAKGEGMKMSDKILAIGMINAKTTGLLLFSSGYLLAVLTMAKETLKEMWKSSVVSRQQSDIVDSDKKFTILYHFFTALIIVAFSFFLFQTESHDRYAFPVCVFFLLWGVFYVYRTNTEKMRTLWWKTRSFRIFIIGYVMFSFLFFLNLHTALSYNYPRNSISALLFLRSPLYTIPLSILQISFFFFFLYVVRKTIHIGVFLISCTFLISCLFALNIPLITHTPVAVSKLTPLISQQGYAGRVTDMPVNAGGPSKNWNRLSVQYSFYKKGIGTHASSYIVYDIGGLFRRFTSDVGIDTEAGTKGSVVFAVYGDNGLLYQSDIVRRFEYPRHVDIDITGVKKISLIVDDGGDGISDDHADWLNPLLFP